MHAHTSLHTEAHTQTHTQSRNSENRMYASYAFDRSWRSSLPSLLSFSFSRLSLLFCCKKLETLASVCMLLQEWASNSGKERMGMCVCVPTVTAASCTCHDATAPIAALHVRPAPRVSARVLRPSFSLRFSLALPPSFCESGKRPEARMFDRPSGAAGGLACASGGRGCEGSSDGGSGCSSSGSNNTPVEHNGARLWKPLPPSLKSFVRKMFGNNNHTRE